MYASSGSKVSYEGSIYENKWWSTNEMPGESNVWKFVSKCSGTTITTPPTTGGSGNCADQAWDTSATYTGGNAVSYQSKTYKAKWWTSGDMPGTNAVWEYVSDCGSSLKVTNSRITSEVMILSTVVDSELQFRVNATEASAINTAIYDLTGKLIVSETFNKPANGASGVFVQDVSSLRSGVYLTKFSLNESTIVKRFVKN